MLALTRSLRCLELYASIGATMSDWKREVGDGFDGIEPLLIPTERLARRWSRPGKPAMRIVDHGNGCAVAICDDELSPPVVLAHSDRVLYRPDGKRLRKRLSEALDLFPSKVIAAPIPGLMQVGEWRPEPSLSVLVWLAVAQHADDLVRLTLDANAAAQNPIVLLTLTRANWSPRSESAIREGAITLIPIDDVVADRQGTWAQTSAWDGFVSHLAPRSKAGAVSTGKVTSDDETREQLRLLKEMERHSIIALAENNVIGLDSTKQPSQKLIAQWAGYEWDASFKAALSSLVKAGFLGNGKHHGRRGGYFLTPKGEVAAAILDQS